MVEIIQYERQDRLTRVILGQEHPMGYDKQQATEEFTRWSRSYDRSILQTLLFGPSHRAILKRIQIRHPRAELQILDIGCGTGVFIEKTREVLPEANIWGVDLVSGMLLRGAPRWARHQAKVQPVKGDSERLPFASGQFDVLTCSNSFHHYPNQENAVREMFRVLKPGGSLILVDGYRDGPWGWLIYDVCVAGVEGNVHHCSSQRVRSLCESAGFETIEQKVHRGPAPFLLTEAITPGSHLAPSPRSGRLKSVTAASPR